MRYLEEKKSNVSTLIENQFPFFVQQNNPQFIAFLSSYYESLENKYHPLDIVSNLIEYYNIGHYRPHTLIGQTKLNANLFANASTIPVEDTTGFPSENGYIKINNEIIFYRSITANSFVDCVRGTSALVLENVPKSEVVLTSSTADEHESGSIVENIAYNYSAEFFKRIKSEIAPLITENVVGDLDYSQFLKNIKSFYSAKGSLNGHRIIFKILFNDKKYNVLLKPRGSGAELKINNYNRYIPIDPPPQIISGGSEYDNRRDSISNELINSPVVDILGSGTGSVNAQGLRPNETAIVKVTNINSAGTITAVEVVDTGEEYIGPIRARVRPRSFVQDQRVYNASGTGYGRVEFWDGFRNELVLYDVIGFFRSDDEIIGIDGEEPRAFISRAFIGTTSIRSGVETIPEVQNIEFPREYTFKTSNANYEEKKILKCRIIRGDDITRYGELPQVLTLKQDPDLLFGVSGTELQIDNITPLRENTYEFEVSSSSILNKLYLPPSTEISRVNTYTGNNFIVTVDDASRFPLTNGIIYVNGILIQYAYRSIDQFFDCEYYSGDSLSAGLGDKVISWGRKKYTVKWDINQTINQGEFRYYIDNLYKAVSNGTTSLINGPTHTSGVRRDGTYADGNPNPVKWEYVGKNTLRHTLYSGNTEFELIAVPGEVVIVDGGSLHTKLQYEFSKLDSPNQQSYYFTDKDISDRLSVILSSNYNRSKSVITDDRLPSFGSLYGFSSLYDFDEYIYVPSSTIPRWWNEIVDLSQTTLSPTDEKKVAFTNQKLISRYNKSTLIYETRVVTDPYPTKQSVALNADAIQVNSFKGNTINYGKINTFTIASGGDYKVVFKQNNTFDLDKLPSFVIKSDDDTQVEVSNQNKLIKISAGFHSINFNKLAELWQNSGELQGFTTKPVIQIINNNPKKQVVVTRNSLNLISNTFTVQYSNSSQIEFKTADRVKYFTPLSNTIPPTELTNVIPALVDQNEYYIAVISESSNGYPKTVEYSLHKTQSDAILNSNKISLNYLNYMGYFSFSLVGDSANPIDFIEAEFDLSYNDTTKSIDNIIIRNSGSGYIEAPTIKIIGGGKSEIPNSEIVIPYTINGIEIIEMRGSLISYTNYSEKNYYEIDLFDNIDYSYENAPEIIIDGGSNAEAVAYVANGKIVSIIPTNPGKNYFSVPSLRLIGSGGSGKNAVIEPIIENGEVSSFNVINPGEGYIVPVTVEIIPSGSGGVVSARLNEWTFNLVQRLETIGRIDSFGGYVYDESDYEITSSVDANNPLKFINIIPNDDLAPSLDDKQYLLLNSSKKLLAKYTLEQRGGLLSVLYPGTNFTYQTTQGVNELLNTQIHSPVIAVAYDGVPVYGNRGYSTRYDDQSSISEIPSRYKLKYSTTTSPGSVSIVVGGITYYLNRIGGPSVLDYPIGSFIEDYEFIPGDENSLDIHNGRFCVTPEYPDGRYCYFETTSSFDPITNEIISQSNINFNGFPYFIGNNYASIPDPYTNKLCRTNDKIPKVFTRAVDIAIPPIPSLLFPGLPANNRYPKEDISNDRTICRASSLTPGSVESVIIESPGKNYRVGDSLLVDNTLTLGSGFGGFVSRVEGKPISNFIVENGKITVYTNEPNGLSVNDFVYFDFITPVNPVVINFHNSNITPISSKFRESESVSVLLSNTIVNNYSNKKFYSLSLNKKFKYKFNIPNVPYSFTYDIDRLNEYFVVEDGSNSDPTSIVFDASNLPNILYLHIGDNIYEIFTSIQFSGEYRVNFIDNINNSFTFNIPEDITTYETTNIKYTTKSINATGGISEISVSNGGFNYRKLPAASVESKTGTGAVIQVDSSTIGKIRNIKYLTAGGGFTSNLNVNYYLNLPSTAKIINNFEIYEVEVMEGGNFYNDQLQLLVNGKSNLAEFQINVQLGVITSIDVIDGGSNFETIPELEVVSTTGIGAVLRAKIRRKKLFNGETVTAFANSPVFPVTVTAKTLFFDELSSTFEYDQYDGQLKDGDLLYTSDGKKYGKIIKIRKPLAYAKVKPYITLESSKLDVSGNTSEFLQKITDSNVYQDWSYILSSSRDTREWRQQVEVNTHPAGHRLFGKKVIDRRKSFFDRPEDVFKTSVIFTANLVNEILLKVKLTPCKDQVIALLNLQDFTVGDYVFGSVSESIGRVEEITEYSLKLSLLNDTRFIIGEYIVKVPASFSFGVETATSRSFAFWNGIMQEPDYSYESAFRYEDEFGSPLTVPVVETLIPKFDLSETDELLHYILTNPLTIYDSSVLNSTDSLYFPSIDNKSVFLQSDFLDNTIISVGGVVQNPESLELNVVERYVRFLDSPNFDATVFAVSSDSLHRLSFTGPTTGTTFTINYTPSDNCQLLIFYVGVDQSHLLTDYSISGNTVIFSETVDLSNIFGWYIQETVECSQINVIDLLNNRITGTWKCDTKNFTQFIHSSAVKTPSSLYELRKEYLDGTVYPSSDGTTLFGFDTRFSYTSPEYSTSFIEVLNKINFDGSTKSFVMTRLDNIPYSPSNGKNSLMVYIDNEILDIDEYQISGQTIIFDTAYLSTQDCTIIDFNSSYRANDGTDGAINLDRLDVQYTNTRKTFNLSDRGVPQYTKNVGDVFSIRNGVLQRMDTTHQSLNKNKITFDTAPQTDETLELVYFNRQLLPFPSKNIVLDDFFCFDGQRVDFPLTINGIKFTPENVYHIFVVRNGVYQKAGIDYRLGTTEDQRCTPGLGCYNLDSSHIIFSDAPSQSDSIVVFYSSDNLNQNFGIDEFRYFDGNTQTFAITKDYISKTPYSMDHIQIYRNGVYQYSGIDYTLETTNGGPRVTFATAPVATDTVYVTAFDSSSNFVNITSNFSQISTTVIHNNSTSITNNQIILIYKNGLLITEGWTFDSANQDITFDEIFTIDSYTRIFLVSNCFGLIDNFVKFDGLTTVYPLTKNYVSKTPYSGGHIQIYRNGVYQYSGIDYTLETTNGGPRVMFTTAPVSTDTIWISNFDSNTHFYDVTDDFSPSTTPNSTEFDYSGSLSLGSYYLFIFIDGLMQVNGSYSYDDNTDILTFSESIDTTTQKLSICAIGNQVQEATLTYSSQTIDQNGFVHTKYVITDVHPEMVDSYDALVNYSGIVQNPEIDYQIYTEDSDLIFELVTNFTPNSNKLFVFDISKNSYEILDHLESLIQVTGDEYKLKFTENYQTISTLTDEELLIQINGVVQEIGSYEIDGSTVTLIGENYESAKLYDLSGANLISIDYLSEKNSTTKYKLLSNYASFTSSITADVFVLRESVLQNPTEDYTVGTGFILFTTPINQSTDIYIKYVNTTQEIYPLTPDIGNTYTLQSAITDPESTILYLNGVIGYHGVDFTISGNTLSLTSGNMLDVDGSLFLIKYSNLTFIDNLENCIDGSNTKFKLLYQGKNVEALTAVDILTNRSGIIQNPEVDYTVESASINGNTILTYLNFVTAPSESDTVFFVRMYGNKKINLTAVGSSTTNYTTTDTVSNYENVYIFANGIWVLPTEDYSMSGSTFVLNNSSETPVFGIEFDGIVKILDQINTPYDSSRKLFNLFKNEENFLTAPTIDGGIIPDETSLIVTKNRKVLDPKVDYILTGDIKSQIEFIVAPSASDIISIKSVGSMLKLDTIITGFNGSTTTFDLTRSGSNYYPNAEIERPREHENQILVIKDGYVQSPIYDYYINNNKLIFVDNIPSADTSKLVVIDFRGTSDDVEVYNRFNQVEVGDEIRLDGAKLSRKVTEIISPTILKTESTGEQVHYGFSADVNYSSGRVQSIDVLSGGTGYTTPVVIRTKGTGAGSKSVGKVNQYQGGSILDSLQIQYPGYNVYRDQQSYATVYGSVFKYQPLNKSQIRRATTLSQNINDTVESFTISNASGLPSDPPVVQLTSDTGSGATFRVFVSNEQIRKVEILTPGIGYDEISLKLDLVSSNGSGCVLEPVLDAMGSLTSIIVRNGGVGYDTFRVIICDDNPISNSEVDVEFIEYTYVDGNTLLGCTRGVARSHTQGDYVYFDNYL